MHAKIAEKIRLSARKSETTFNLDIYVLMGITSSVYIDDVEVAEELQCMLTINCLTVEEMILRVKISNVFGLKFYYRNQEVS